MASSNPTPTASDVLAAKQEVRFFTFMRKTIVESIYRTVLQVYHQALPSTIEFALINIKNDFTHQLIDIQYPLNIANMGRCFRMRTDLIIQTLNELTEMLEQNPEPLPVSYLGGVLDMVATQVGRLTLCGHSGEDEYADEMDEHSITTDESWNYNHNADQADFLAVWARLRVTDPTCACCQCRKRNQRTVPR